jgi:hypothetical protein
VAETPYFKFRLPPGVLADLNALAASNGGNNTLALKEAVAYWRAEAERAARLNAAALTAEEWTLLGHLGDPSDYDLPDDVCPDATCRDWAMILATGLAQMYDGRPVLLPSHKAERKAAAGLARKVAGWGIARGYALMAALRYFWRHPEAGIGACASPEIWLTPTAREPG